MVTQLERIKNELLLAGYSLEPYESTDVLDNYVQSVGCCVWELCKLFDEQGHSGMSAGLTLSLLKKLLIDEKPLTPLTNNPDEWESDMESWGGDDPLKFQSKRDFSCFSDDGLKTYYDIDDPDNRDWELDNNGNKTGWSSFNKEKAKRVPLKDCKDGADE